MIPFLCARCRGRVEAADTDAGAVVVCPTCGQRLLVPTVSSAPLPGVPLNSDDGYEEEDSPRTVVTMGPPADGMSCLIALLLALGFFVFMAMTVK